MQTENQYRKIAKCEIKSLRQKDKEKGSKEKSGKESKKKGEKNE